MNHVYIVDDECNVINLIVHLVDWDALDLCLIGSSTDSPTALEQILLLKPDILIADINMPGLSGLDLIEKVSKQLPDMRTVVVSGYQDFNYAYKAIKHGVEDYLLKPLNKNELNKSLSRLINAKNHDGNDSSTQIYIHELEDRIRSSSARLRKQLVGCLSINPVELRDCSITKANAQYGYHFAADTFVVCLLQLDKKEYTTGLSNSIFNKVENFCREMLEPIASDWECYEQKSDMIFLFNISSEQHSLFEQELRMFFNYVKSIVASYQVLEPTLSVGIYVDSISASPYSYQSAVMAGYSRVLLGRNRIIYANSIPKTDSSVQLEPFFAKGLSMETGDRETLRRSMRKDLVVINEFLAGCPAQVFSVYTEYLEKFFSTVYERFGFPTDIDLYKRNAAEAVRQQCSLQSIEKVALEYLDEIYDVIQQSKNTDKRIILMAKAYMEENCAKRIGLEEVAQHVHLSPSYFGMLFKRETGINFTDYLVSVRMEAAKELLKGIDMNVSEIALRVGYNNTKHFSKKFKSIVGVTPYEYRTIYQMYD